MTTQICICILAFTNVILAANVLFLAKRFAALQEELRRYKNEA